ncbi:MAG: flagellar export protein FliJ [Methylococcales bacterium]|nr:flagellar export protein FliJ [Methylococcales bacterium]
MSQPQRLNFLAQLYRDQAQEALEALGRLQQQREQQQQQISQLQQYWQDYLQKMQTFAAQGARAGQLIEFRLFIDKLEVAIQGQEKQLHKLTRQCEEAGEHWRQLHFKSKALTEMADKAQAKVLKTQEDRLQKELDDRSAINFRIKNGPKNAG